MCVVFAVLLLRILYLQVVDHDRLLDLAKDNVLREQVLPAIRGVIRDRNGELLVDSEPSCTVAIDPFHRAFRQDEEALERTLDRLSTIIEIDPEEMAATIEEKKGRSYMPVFLKRHLDIRTVAYIEEHREELPGISIEIEARRRYVHGELAAHLLGYVGEISESEVRKRPRPPTAEEDRGGALDRIRSGFGGRRGKGGDGAGEKRGLGRAASGAVRAAAVAAGAGDPERSGAAAPLREYRAGDVIGRAGMESQFEARLCGRNGVRMVEVNALGRRIDPVLRVTPYAEVIPPVAGEEMILTLDLDLQRAAEAAFPDSFSGAVVVIDARDGEILAAFSRPAFDPNEFAKGFSGEAWKALSAHPAHPLLNRALRSAYPPGSVLKVVTGAAVLSLKEVRPDELMKKKCVGGYRFGDRFFGCHHTHGTADFAEAMRVSCDTYFYQAGLLVGLERLGDFARRFGIGQRTGIVLGERNGNFPDAAWYDHHYGKREWTRGVVLNLSIGQGEILTTPLQLAVMMGATGTGRLVVPRLVRSIGGDPGPVVQAPRELDVPPDVRRLIVDSLEHVVSEGTGRRARVDGVRVAGKTGTAQNPHGEDHAVFAAFAPVGAPEVAVAVVVENIGHGGEFAAPVAQRILEAYFADRTPELAVGGD